MQRDGEYPRVVGEGRFYAIAMVHIDVDVGHPGRSTVEQPADQCRQRQALVAMLSDRDFETQVACDGQEALERLTAFNADVIVADLVMPRMDGFELLRHLKERGDLTPAIALTGFGSIACGLYWACSENATFTHASCSLVVPNSYMWRCAANAYMPIVLAP